MDGKDNLNKCYENIEEIENNFFNVSDNINKEDNAYENNSDADDKLIIKKINNQKKWSEKDTIEEEIKNISNFLGINIINTNLENYNSSQTIDTIKENIISKQIPEILYQRKNKKNKKKII